MTEASIASAGSLANSKAMLERARRSLGGGVSSGLRATMLPHPIYFERGIGSRLIDVDGNSYLDYVLGWGPLIAGHSHRHIVQAVQRQVALSQTFGSGHRLEFEVAEQVLDRVPGLDRLLWSNTGTEAVQVALRLARAATGRRKVLKFAGGYHGWHDTALISYRKLQSPPSLNSLGQNPSVLADVLVCDFNDTKGFRQLVAENQADLAAVIVEPVLANSGLIEPEPHFLAVLREECDRIGTLLIFDEVITGFRLARGGAIERYGVIPDLATFGKAIAGGFSLSAVGGRAEIIDLVTTGVVHAGTYNGNPVALAGASATLDLLDSSEVYDSMEKTSHRLASGLQVALVQHGLAWHVHHVGPMVQVLPNHTALRDARPYEDLDWTIWNRLTVELLARGVFVLPGGRFFLSLVHTHDDVRATVDAFSQSLDALQEGSR